MECKTITTSAGPVHYADFGGEGEPVVLVHGLGGAHTNWMAVGRELALSAPGYRVFAPDLIGFGRTPPAGRSPGVNAQVKLISTFMREVAGGPSVVIGNSMGGLVSLMTAAAHPEQVRRLVLVNSAFPRPLFLPVDRTVALLFSIYMIPFAGELFLARRTAQLGVEKVSRATLRLCGVDPARMMPEMYEASLAVAKERAGMSWANEMFVKAARSVMRHIAAPGLVHREVQQVKAPTLLIQGSVDRLVPRQVGEAIARRRPDWQFELMEGVGHTPQMEVPDRWLAAVTRFLAGRAGGQ